MTTTRRPRARARLSTAGVVLAVVALLAGCEAATVDSVNDLRADVGVPTVTATDSLAASARAHSTELCAEGVLAPSDDPVALHDGETHAAVTELVGRAPVDPTVEDRIARTTAAGSEIFEGWADDPTLVDPGWDEIGVGEVECGDGQLYQTLVLAREPTMPASGRYVSIQHPLSTIVDHVGLQYGTAVDWQGVSVPLLLDLYVPPGAVAEPRPTIVFVHGGGFSSGSRTASAGAMRDLARRGYVAVSIDYRLDPRVSGAVQDELLLAAAGNAIDDAMESVRWLKANAGTYGIDPDRIAMLGGSAGGAIVLGVGATDDPTPGGPLAGVDPSVRAVASTGAHLTPGLEAGLLDLDEDSSPALMFHFDTDTSTGNTGLYAFFTCAALRGAGSTCDFVSQPGAGHTVSLFPTGAAWPTDVGPFVWHHLGLGG